jgi:hypothetical protein
MSIIRNSIVAVLFVSIVCVRGANAAGNTSETILAQPEAAVSQQSGEASIDVLSWLISQFSDAVPSSGESASASLRGLKAPPLW